MATKSKLELAVETGQWEAGLKRAHTALNTFQDSIGGVGNATKQQSQKMAEFVKMMANMETTSKTTKGKLNELTKVYTELSVQYKHMTDQEKQSPFGKEMSKSIDVLKGRVQSLKSDLEDVSKSVSNTGKSKFSFDLGSADGLKGMAASMAKFTGLAYAGTEAAMALKSAIAGNIETAKQFEKSMSQLSSLTGLTGDDLNKLKDSAIELGGSTTQSASQVADAFRLIGSQMPQLLESTSALSGVTKEVITLSEAAGIDLQDAAKTVAVSINQMGAPASDAARYVNVLAAASQKGAGDIAWLGEAITNSGTAAKAVGTGYEELVANLEQLAQAGYDASSAGTALRSIIMNLEKQSNQQYKPSVVGLTQAFENLGKANLTLIGYQEIAGKLFAAQAKTLAENTARTNELRDSITGTNTAEEQASTNTNNLDGSLKQLSSAWERFNLTLNDSNGGLKTLVDWLATAVNWMADMAKHTTEAEKAVRKFNEANGITNDNKNYYQKEETREDQKKAYHNRANQYRQDIQQKQNELNRLNEIAKSSPAVAQSNYGMRKQLEIAIKALKEEEAEFIKGGVAFFGGSALNKGKNTVSSNTPTTPVTDKNKLKTDLSGITDIKPIAIGGTESMKELNAQLSRYKNNLQEAKNAAEQLAAQRGIEETQKKIAAQPVALSLSVSTEDIVPIKDSIDNFFKENKIELIPDGYFANFNLPTTNEEKSDRRKSIEKNAESYTWSGFTNDITGGIDTVVSSLESLGVDIPEGISKGITIMQSLLGVATGIMTIVTAIQTIQTASLVRSAIPFFANGGVIPHAANGFVGGSNYSGDITPIYANASEMVINQTDQRKLYDAIHGNTLIGGGGNIEFRIKGTNLVGVEKNTRRKIRG